MKQRTDQTNDAIGTESIDARIVVLENVQPVPRRFLPKYLCWETSWSHSMMCNFVNIAYDVVIVWVSSDTVGP